MSPVGDGAQLVTPGEIDAVEFTTVRNLFTGRVGYDEHEVDDFLDRCADTIAKQRRELDATYSQLERARAGVSS